MPRLIDADALESKAKSIYMEYENVIVSTRVIPISDLHLAPTIDAEPVRHARWEGKKWSYLCSICGGLSLEDGGCKTNYCPDCGAKMDLED